MENSTPPETDTTENTGRDANGRWMPGFRPEGAGKKRTGYQDMATRRRTLRDSKTRGEIRALAVDDKQLDELTVGEAVLILEAADAIDQKKPGCRHEYLDRELGKAASTLTIKPPTPERKVDRPKTAVEAREAYREAIRRSARTHEDEAQDAEYTEIDENTPALPPPVEPDGE